MKKFTPIILIALAIGLFFVFIDPQYKKAQELLKEKEQNDTMLELAEQLQKKRDQLRNDFNNISEEERKQLEKLLPDTVDNVRLILDINNIAENYGIIIRNIGIETSESAEAGESSGTSKIINTDSSAGIGTITLSFSVSATYEVYLQFLRDLEEALRVVDIKELNIGTGEGVFYTYDITLDTYWLR